MPAQAQISLTSAVGLAIKNSPKVKMAEADVDRAKAGLQESKDVYVPSIVAASSGAGYSYGFPLGTPTVFNVSAQSLVFSFSQRDYIRAATAGLSASNYSLQDAREQIAEDTVITYLTLERDQQQHTALAQELDYASRLANIVKERLDAGQDTAMEYTRARRTGVQIRLQMLQLEDAIVIDADHLSRLIGLPGTKIEADSASIPKLPTDLLDSTQLHTSASIQSLPDSAGVEAAYANARSKREQAFGDSRYTFRPQLSFGAQYSRFSTYNNTYVLYYPHVDSPGLSDNAIGFAVNVSVPILDAARRARARASLAEAARAEHEADLDRDQYREGRLRIERSMEELKAHAELASLDRDLAQEQLDVVLLQLKSAPGSPGVTPTNPKDEQNARILERQRYFDMLEAEFQVRQATVHLLRQTGGLVRWLAGSAGSAALTSTP
jgi:outer membrane protein TolC